MSLFYKNKEEEHQKNQQNNLYPQIDRPKKSEQSTFKKKEAFNSRASVFIEKEKQPQKEPGMCDKCCACFSLQYYKDYFKVTNADVKKRILCNLKFWSGGFFQPPQQEYDLYGPFWLYTTMVFIVGAVHNVLIYQNSPDNNFQYDFQIIGIAMTIFYLLGLGLSVLMGLLFGCLGLSSKTSQIVCLYGYSMATYIIAVLLCSINMTLMTWLFLLYAAGAKIGFVLKNIFDLQVPPAKKVMVIIMVVLQAAIQFFVIKFSFIKTSNDSSAGAAFSHMEVVQPYLHVRNF